MNIGFLIKMFFIISLVICTFSLSFPVYAYLGPGAGLGLMGSLIAVVIAFIVIVFGLIIYPVRRILRRRKLQ